MKIWPVLFDPDAEFDLEEIHDWIARQASERIADGYVARIVDFCYRLRTFPERGTERNDVAPGARIIGFERRASIVFVIDADEIRVLRIVYAGRQLDGD